MASQAAIITIGFTRGVTAKKGARAMGALQCGALEAATKYTGGSGLLSSRQARFELPPIRVPFGTVQPDGSVLVNSNWYRVLDYIVNTQLGGPEGPTLSDISTTVDDTRTSAISAQNAVSVVAQTVNANADTLAATVQVAQANNLSGSSQIPAPSYTRKGVQP